MKNVCYKLCAFLLVSLFGALALAKEGGNSGGGGDLLLPQSGSAWFLNLSGNREVTYCIDRDPSFGASLEDSRQTIEAAFAHWIKYIDGKKLSDVKVARRLRYSGNCSSSTDLVFYFGVMNHKVSVAKKRYDRPISFAIRTSYDVRTGWGQGFIWFTKDSDLPADFAKWSVRQALYFQLLHELGHVFGNGHVEATVMDPDLIGFYLKSIKSDPNYLPLTIDITRELAHCHSCVETYAGGTDHPYSQNFPFPKTTEIDASIFKMLVGREPVGTPQISLEVNWGMFQFFDSATLHVSDAQGAKDLFVSPNGGINGGSYGASQDAVVFKTYSEDGQGHVQGSFQYGDHTMFLEGAITLADGQRLAVRLVNNLPQDGVLKLEAILPGNVFPIFVANPPSL